MISSFNINASLIQFRILLNERHMNFPLSVINLAVAVVKTGMMITEKEFKIHTCSVLVILLF